MFVLEKKAGSERKHLSFVRLEASQRTNGKHTWNRRETLEDTGVNASEGETDGRNDVESGSMECLY